MRGPSKIDGKTVPDRRSQIGVALERNVDSLRNKPKKRRRGRRHLLALRKISNPLSVKGWRTISRKTL
jgi:hypothetical protein